MRIQRSKLLGLLQGINAINLPGVKFNYALIKNKNKIQSELEVLSKVMNVSKELGEYDVKRTELCKVHCTKDAKSKPVIKNKKYEGLDNHPEFEKGLKELETEYKDALDGRKKQVEEYNTLILEEIDIPLHEILFKDVPEQITTRQLDSIMLLISE